MNSENNSLDFSSIVGNGEMKEDIPKYNTQENPYFTKNENNKNIEKKEKHKYSFFEKILIPISLIFSILLNFWVINFDMLDIEIYFSLNAFYSVVIIVYIILIFKKIRKNLVVWIALSLIILLNIWNYIFDYTSQYGQLVLLVIPAVLFTVIEYVKYEIEFKNAIYVMKKWISDLILWPFSAARHFFGSNISIFKSMKSNNGAEKINSSIKKIGIGLLISLPVLLITLPLLLSADIAFANFFDNIWNVIFYDTKIGDIIFNLIKILIYIIFIYSFLWNVFISTIKNNNNEKKSEKKYWDTIIISSFLIILLIFYAIFCVMQFTYLFAGKGLPDGITYSTYARDGFSQIIMVSVINLTMFALLDYFTKNDKIILLLKGLLLLTTTIMLVSSFLRLNLYIKEYHMTWLRLLPLWFIFFLGAVIILCIVKMIKKDFMIIGIASLMLLVWFVVLGYSNPERIIAQYNIDNSEDLEVFLIENQYMILRYHASSDEILCYYDNGIDIYKIYAESQVMKDRGYIEIKEVSRYNYNSVGSKRNLTSHILMDKYREAVNINPCLYY